MRTFLLRKGIGVADGIDLVDSMTECNFWRMMFCLRQYAQSVRVAHRIYLVYWAAEHHLRPSTRRAFASGCALAGGPVAARRGSRCPSFCGVPVRIAATILVPRPVFHHNARLFRPMTFRQRGRPPPAGMVGERHRIFVNFFEFLLGRLPARLGDALRLGVRRDSVMMRLCRLHETRPLVSL